MLLIETHHLQTGSSLKEDCNEAWIWLRPGARRVMPHPSFRTTAQMTNATSNLTFPVVVACPYTATLLAQSMRHSPFGFCRGFGIRIRSELNRL